MQSVTITIPIPPKACSPNSRAGWRAKAAGVAQQRLDASMYATSQFRGMGPLWPRVRLTVRWFAKLEHYHLDYTNVIASLKGAEDGLQDAGVIQNDRGVEGSDLIRLVDKAKPRVEITVEPVK